MTCKEIKVTSDITNRLLHPHRVHFLKASHKGTTIKGEKPPQQKTIQIIQERALTALIFSSSQR